jgi:hypothetical protein
MRRFLGLAMLVAGIWLQAGPVSASEFVFLQDGRVIQADKVEVIGDRVRVEKPAETIELPRSEVLSIHPYLPPSGSPGAPSPADTYRDITQQMNDKVRREIEGKPGKAGAP